MTTPTVFQFEKTHPVRSIVVGGEPWFVAADVCKALQLTNSRVMLRSLDDDEKGVSSIYTPGGEQKLAIVNESGLYTLILRCRDAVKAGTPPHRFRKWVTSEVLPTIRKTGGYQFGKNAGDVLSLEQADLLRNAMTTHCARLPKNQQGPFMVKGWSKLKAHFKVSYRHIPQEQLTEALSIVTRHAAEWEVVDDVPALGAPDRDTIEALCSHMEFLRSWFARVSPGLRALNPRLESAAYGHFIDGVIFARSLVKDLRLKSSRSRAEEYPWDGGFADRLEYNRSFT